MSAGERADTWRGFTPEQMTEKLRDRARVKRTGVAYTTNIPTDRLLDEAADLIDWLAMENAVLVAEQRYCQTCKQAPGERCRESCTNHFRHART